MSVFSEKLVQLRTAANISQGELARRIGVSRQAVSNLEADKNAPAWDTVQRLALALGVDYSVFADPNIVLPEVPPRKPAGRPRKRAGPPAEPPKKGRKER